jgi:hypothetical protein
VQEVPILIVVLVIAGMGRVTVLVGIEVVTVLVGMEVVTATVLALAEASETKIMAISDTMIDTMPILKIIDLICYILLKYIIPLKFKYLESI